MATKDDLYAKLQEARDLVTQAQLDRCAYDADLVTYQASMAKVLDVDIGPIKDVADQAEAIARELLDTPVPPPDPTPPVPQYQGFAVSYAGHDPARDCYLGTSPDQKEWGRHDGLPVLAPAPGRVELYQFPTPLNAPKHADPEYVKRERELFGGGWVCMAPLPDAMKIGGPLYGTQAMFVAVYWPDTPIRLANGQMLRAAWFGHCKGDIPTGRVETGGRICTSYDSGIRFENNGIQARAAHVHTCGSATSTLSMNGDVDGLLVAQVLGWQIEWRGTGGPGPDQYMSGQWIAGKPRSQWTGRALPPMPN